MRKLILLRRLSQGFFLAVFIYILWSTTYPLKGLLPADTFFKINPLIMIITSISERVFLSGMIFIALMIVLTIILGRFFCGWVCPLGTCIDMAGRSRKTQRVSDETNKKIRIFKFFLLAAVLILALWGVQAAWVFDPMVIMARFVSLNLIPTVTIFLDKIFIAAIKAFGFYAPLYDFYRALKSSILGINIYYFAHSIIIFMVFLAIVGAALFLKRFWCRIICPLGAFYAFVASFSLISRSVEECNRCKACKAKCRMGAINDDLGYEKSECILCMDCLYGCAEYSTSFRFMPLRTDNSPRVYNMGDAQSGMSRRSFLSLMALSTLSLVGFKYARGVIGRASEATVIRPPAALKEEEFLNRCIRCGNCMKVCITNGLQPAFLESGLQGIWTPQLVPEIGYCEYQCTLCGNVCPTGAIPKISLAQKKKTVLGLAKIDKAICLPWAENKECIVCEEHCPVSNKAIKLKRERYKGKTILQPYVVKDLCVGCAICQTKCPVRPQRAIKVYPTQRGGPS